MQSYSRRSFIAGAGMAVTACSATRLLGMAPGSTSPFKIAVITDEIDTDFDHACYVAANEFGFQWVELRSLWNKNLQTLNDAEVSQAVKILAKYNLRVTDIASPLFKVDWPGAPKSQYSPKNDSFGAEYNFKQQDQVMEHCIALAKQFKTDKVRGFDFWRLDDVKPYRAAINAKLQAAATL